jgi:hypothetical protein
MKTSRAAPTPTNSCRAVEPDAPEPATPITGEVFDSRVAAAHCCAAAPSEPGVRLSTHRPQASPEGVQVRRREDPLS